MKQGSADDFGAIDEKRRAHICEKNRTTDLLARMGEPAMLANRGHIGIEFCDYDPEECPFGAEFCNCKDF